MNVQTVTIENIGSVKGGKRLPKGHELLTTPTNHPYIRARDIGGGKVEIREPVYISNSTYQKIKQYTVKNNDIVVTIIGVNIGDVGIISGSLNGANLTENASKITTNSDVCDPKFLLCQLSTPYNKFKFQQIAAGAAQGKLGLFKIKSFKITLLPIDIQNKISDIHFSYTLLLENNRRRIHLLEEAARLLYREWFVYFRFPGYEKVKFVEHEGIDIPEGWEKKKIKKVLSLEYGKSLVADKREEGSIPVYGSSGVIGFHNRALVNGPGIVVGRAGNAGSVHWVDEDFFPVDSTFYVKTKMNEYLLYFYHYLSICHLERFISGSAVPGLNRNIVYSSTILIPNKDILNKFTDVVQQIAAQCSCLRNQNKKLSQARDLLLPRLMSGKIEV